MLGLIALIPGIGAPLAAALAAFGGVLKPAVSAAGGFISAALRNPYVLGALVAAAFFLLWHTEEGDKAKLRLDGDKRVAAWSDAFALERASFRTVDDALKGQNTAVERLWAAGRPKLKASAQIAAAAVPAHARAQAQSAAILAAPKGATDCASAQATFDAARKALR